MEQIYKLSIKFGGPLNLFDLIL